MNVNLKQNWLLTSSLVYSLKNGVNDYEIRVHRADGSHGDIETNAAAEMLLDKLKTKFSVAIYDEFEGSLKQEIIVADNELEALKKVSTVTPHLDDYNNFEGMTAEQAISTYFNQEIQIKIQEI